MMGTPEANEHDEQPLADPYHRKLFHQEHSRHSTSTIVTLKAHITHSITKTKKQLKQKSFYKNILFTRVPIFKWLFFEYNFKASILHDIIGGFTVGVMSIPQTMGISMLANLPPVNGLYMSFFPIFIYFLFGTSKHLVVGAISVVGLFSGEVVEDMSIEYEKVLMFQNVSANITESLMMDYKVSVACGLAFFVGVIEILMGLTGLGKLVTYFSDPFISGYTCGSAIHAVLSQAKSILGLTNTRRFNGAFKIPRSLFDLATKLPSVNIPTLLTSIFCILFLVLFKDVLNPKMKKCLKFEFPSELLLVIITSAVSYLGDFGNRYKMSIVKQIPKGLPQFQTPNFMLWTEFAKSGFITALIAFSISISLAQLYARKNRYKINSHQELYALGATNIFASFFGCFPSAGSLSRTSLMNNSGGRSQMASLFSALIILVVILWLGPLFEPLPKAVLASIMIVALKGLVMQITDLPYYWKINKYEALSWLGTFLSVVLLDVDIGLFAGLLITVALITIKDQRVELVKLTRLDDTSSTFVDETLIDDYTDQDWRRTGDVKIFKIERSLYFVNIKTFRKQLHKLFHKHTDATPLRITPNGIDNALEMHNDVTKELLARQYFILDFSAVNYIDTTAIKQLLESVEDYLRKNVFLCICQCQTNFIETINRMNLVSNFDNHLFLSLDDALLYIKTVKLNETL